MPFAKPSQVKILSGRKKYEKFYVHADAYMKQYLKKKIMI